MVSYGFAWGDTEKTFRAERVGGFGGRFSEGEDSGRGKGREALTVSKALVAQRASGPNQKQNKIRRRYPVVGVFVSPEQRRVFLARTP